MTMWLRRTNCLRKNGLAVICFLLLFVISGCGNVPKMEEYSLETANDEPVSLEKSKEDEDKMINLCTGVYDKAAGDNKLSDLETVRSIVNCFGENGYSAVDSKNQIDMTQAERVKRFCEKVDSHREAEIMILVIDYMSGFTVYDFHTKGGTVEGVRSYYEYNNGAVQKNFMGNYRVEEWSYTEEGYLMFSGAYYSEEVYALTLSETEEYVALRAEPLDETCRKLTRKYLLPIGFEQNNLFITDWSEEEFGEVDFYDMYDILYRNINGGNVPYGAEDSLGAGAVYRIPKDEFERVIMAYFKIDSETLQSKTVYYPEDSV